MSSEAVKIDAPRLGTACAPARDIPDAVRIAITSAALVVMWNYRWFVDLTDRDLLKVSGEGSLTNQLVFSTLGLVMAAAIGRLGLDRLRPLANRPMLIFTGWLAVTALLSVNPLVSIRRLVFLGIIALAGLGIVVVPRSGRQFALCLAISVAVVLGASYLGLVLVPNLTIHNGFDLDADPAHAGLWRGIYDGKNAAGAAMTLIIFVGLYVASSLNRAAGWTIVALAFVFLIGSNSKTPLATLPFVVGLSVWCCRIDSARLRAAVFLVPAAFLVLVSLGSVWLPPVKAALSAVMSDPSFTGRRPIWEFAMASIQARPLLGYGYSAFWGSAATLYGADTDAWTGAAHAHNAFLDGAINAGLPGLALLLAVYVALPLRDLNTIAGQPGGMDAATLLFLRIWFFGILSASFEAVFQNPYNTLCGFMFVAVFGLRLRASYRLAA